jgi:hypothetical protein
MLIETRETILNHYTKLLKENSRRCHLQYGGQMRYFVQFSWREGVIRQILNIRCEKTRE